MRSRSSYFLVFLCLTSATYAACGSTANKEDPSELEDAGGTADGTANDASTGEGGGSETGEEGGFNTDSTVGEKKAVSLVIEPAVATIVVKNGDLTTASAPFTAKVKYEDGSSAPIGSCIWNVDRIDVGAMTGSTFKATGSAGGKATVECKTLGLTGTAIADVLLQDVVDGSSGLDEATKKDLVAATATDPTLTKLLYPYDKTVFPKGVRGPELMWTGPSLADVYALVLTEDGMSFTSYFDAAAPSRFMIPNATWTKLLDTNASGGPVTMTLYRLAGGVGGTPYKSTSQTWTIASGSLKGSIYYWRINGGRVVRIKPGASAPDDFLKTTSAEGGCVACHSVSHDGSTMVASYEKAGPLPWVTFDVKTGAEKYYAAGTNSGLQAISPDGSLVVAGQTGGSTLQLSTSGGTLLEPSGLAAFGSTVAHATFSPDGKSLAFAVRKDGNWVDFLESDLALASFDPLTRQFGAMRTLVPAGGKVRTYPSFSPDSQWMAYMEGRKNPISAVNTASTRPAFGDLHMIKPDGSSDVVLEAANNGGVADIDKSLAFEPNFNPVIAGGYFWIVFVSSRQYGNHLNKTNDAFRDACGNFANCRSKQLWVTAIDASPKPGVDPSHPAFWLPGQDLTDQNMRGYWALDPCKNLGEGCEAGFECCDGACKTPDGGGAKVCSKPPPGTCAAVTDKCTTTADCCDASVGVECIGGTCGKKAPS